MRDYVELINQLRECGTRRDCLECPYDSDKSYCIEPRIIQAADAIEELLARDVVPTDFHERCLQLEIRKRIELEKQLPHWISVEDELPSRYETVLLNIQTCKDSYVTIGDYEPNELRFRDFADRNNQVYCGDIVTHWMPLPEPPKGVE